MKDSLSSIRLLSLLQVLEYLILPDKTDIMVDVQLAVQGEVVEPSPVVTLTAATATACRRGLIAQGGTGMFESQADGHGNGHCQECGNTVTQDICDGVSLFLS